MKTRSMPQGISPQLVSKSTSAMPSKKRSAPSSEVARAPKRKQLQAPSLAMTARGHSRKRGLSNDELEPERPTTRPRRQGKPTSQLAHDLPRSRLYELPALSNNLLRRRRLDSQHVRFYYSHSAGLERLTCLITVLLHHQAQEIKFRVPTDDPHQALLRATFARRRASGERHPREETSTLKTTVVVRAITHADDEAYTCRVEAVVGARVWCSELRVAHAWADEQLVMAWMAGPEGTGTVRESTERDPELDYSDAFRFFRTVSVVHRPLLQKRASKPGYRFLVDSWDGLHSMDVEGQIVQRETIYRGDEEERVWVKLRLKVQLSREVVSGRYLYVSGDVGSEEWTGGRFRDDVPGQLAVE